MSPLCPAPRLRLLVVIAAAALGLGSCNILGPASYLAFGAPKVEAQYQLLDRPTVVFVDDQSDAIPLNATRVRRTIADKISTELMARDLVINVISSRDAMALARQRDREDKLLAIDDIGDAAGAEQVIYVQMMSFRGSPDGYTPKPTAICRVKVIDVARRTRLFPAPDAERAWHDVSVEAFVSSTQQYRTPSGRRQIEQMLALLTADRVAKLFYRHVPEPVGSRLQPR